MRLTQIIDRVGAQTRFRLRIRRLDVCDRVCAPHTLGDRERRRRPAEQAEHEKSGEETRQAQRF